MRPFKHRADGPACIRRDGEGYGGVGGCGRPEDGCRNRQTDKADAIHSTRTCVTRTRAAG